VTPLNSARPLSTLTMRFSIRTPSCTRSTLTGSASAIASSSAPMCVYRGTLVPRWHVRRRSPREWRLWSWINFIVVASWLLIGLLLPGAPATLVTGVAALCFGATQVVFGAMLLLNMARLAERLASDSVGRHVMGRGIVANRYPSVWRFQGAVTLAVGIAALVFAAGLLASVIRAGPLG
jgi:hypothetical protein